MTTTSSLSNLPHRQVLRWQTWLILALATAVSVGAYLAYSASSYRVGFPLDDSWIHQTYARNLALRGEWSFIPGQVSGGSTSPLWSALLAIGFWLNLSPYIWAYFLGSLLLFALAVCAETSMRTLVQGYGGIIPWVGLLVTLEWHMVWASVSGMETLFHALVAFLLLVSLIKKTSNWLLLGALTGISVWIRPDGITLLGPVFFVALFSQPSWKLRACAFGYVLLGFCFFFFPYLLFNSILSGAAFPTTFYAKQAEYLAWQATPVLGRIGEGIVKILTGAGIILLPGAVINTRWAIRNKDWGTIAALIWVAGYLGIYMLRLPAYQHGRYLMPVMPIYFYIGLVGFLRFYLTQHPQQRSWWLIKTTWGITLPLVCIGFWFLGMQSYSSDVRFIESEMVDTAKWASTNIPENALIGAHDIGALGYFGDHQLVDMAGLISPDVIPFLRDEAVLAEYLDSRGVEYLIAFPDWYPLLTAGLTPIFSTNAPYALAMGETNLAVYQWPSP